MKACCRARSGLSRRLVAKSDSNVYSWLQAAQTICVYFWPQFINLYNKACSLKLKTVSLVSMLHRLGALNKLKNPRALSIKTGARSLLSFFYFSGCTPRSPFTVSIDYLQVDAFQIQCLTGSRICKGKTLGAPGFLVTPPR